MAIRGVSLAETEEVILPSDPGHPDNPAYKAATKAGKEPETPTKFLIGNLTQACRVEIGDMTTSPTMRDGGVTMELKRTKRAMETVKRGLRGWSNMLDAKGKVIPFVEGTIPTAAGFVKGASDESLAHLPAEVIFELAVKILEKNGLSKAMEGNFDGVSLQSPGDNSAIGDATIAAPTSSESEAAPQPQ